MPSASRNLWSLTVLCLLKVQPLHPYEMQRRIREWKKDNFLDLKRGSLYHAIERLRAAGMIEVVETSREGRRPERTVFRITERGEREVATWLRELLANPARSPTEFYAALSFIAVLTPADALEQLEARAGLLAAEVASWGSVLEMMVPQIGRLPLLEVEYTRATRQAELTWVRSVIDDLRAGRLAWDWAAIRQAVTGALGPPGGSS